ncbi:hypothetical protein BASA50_007001 [Batrachochytrium salamandrivorans]|uniref:PLOD1-3-like GT domain-containing protein n=1 Tax=Batrachochytrium salamandrivorans TaxID=1357716 RepID=A0ABQ8FB46_9FUNG|nr:hypothetical protein BASA61_007020 [Batrachochytrium salamandrivorans]KAH6593945.1 hypothetical protein BASA50_007001 [Batrachochytrium salamandrivorans]KAH9270656.1 hypothetical protein BASA83_007265 [Batrachochytrium salamandrivorans]KAJ1336219.1 hypothetical protein BSLG_007447 [Batrachochytrium salamandrivorans]KAJ1343477.1 hypothetical protein BSLG_001975 [Batrachochytrium salamandrivorans]
MFTLPWRLRRRCTLQQRIIFRLVLTVLLMAVVWSSIAVYPDDGAVTDSPTSVTSAIAHWAESWWAYFRQLPGNPSMGGPDATSTTLNENQTPPMVEYDFTKDVVLKVYLQNSKNNYQTLIPVNPDCNREWRGKQLESYECSTVLLHAAVTVWPSSHSSAWTTPSHMDSSAMPNSPDPSSHEHSPQRQYVQLGVQAHTQPHLPPDSPLPLNASADADAKRERELQSQIPDLLASSTTTLYNAACRNSMSKPLTNTAVSSRSTECPVLWVSYCTNCGLGANRLAQIVTDAGFPLTIVGLGTLWRSRWGLRIRTLHDFLLVQPDERLIIWSDAEDVIITPETTVDKVIDRYRSLVQLYQGPRIFFPAETACYPRGDLWSNYTNPKDIPGGRGDSPFQYLNAGLIIGPAGLIRRMIEVVYQDDCFDDQLVYTLAYLDSLLWWRDVHTHEYQVSSSKQNYAHIPPTAKKLIQLDHWNILAMAMYGIDNEKYVIDDTNTKLTMLETNSHPLILHQSGPKHTNRILEILSQVFGYDYDLAALESAQREGHPSRLLSRYPK